MTYGRRVILILRFVLTYYCASIVIMGKELTNSRNQKPRFLVLGMKCIL